MGVSFPSRDVRLNFARPGIIQSLSAEVGQKVKADQVLAELDQASLISQRSQLQRTPGGEQQLALLEAQIRQGQVVAPFDGIVAEWHFDEGSHVSPSVQVCRLVSDEPPEVECHLTDRQSTSLAENGNVRFSLEGIDYEAELGQLASMFSGITKRATLVAKDLPSNFRDFGTVVEIENSNQCLRGRVLASEVGHSPRSQWVMDGFRSRRSKGCNRGSGSASG